MQGGFFILDAGGGGGMGEGKWGSDSTTSSLFAPIFLSLSLPLLYVSLLIMFITQLFPLLTINPLSPRKIRIGGILRWFWVLGSFTGGFLDVVGGF